MEIFSLDVKGEKDILSARDRARVVCEELGFSITHQLQVTTSVFELGKNIVEHGGGGMISFSILTNKDQLALEVVGKDEGPGLSGEEVDSILKTPSSGSKTALRGIPAIKRLMDSIDIDSEPGEGTTIRLVKNKPKTAKTLTENIVDFIQNKFSARKSPSISEEIRMQNLNLVQTLSLYEEKNQELQNTNQELLELKKKLEDSNAELQNRTMELQEALLSLGDRTSELESHNRRFNAVLKQMSEGLAISDRSGQVSTVNKQFCQFFGIEEEKVEGIDKQKWYKYLGQYSIESDEEWNKSILQLNREPKKNYTFQLQEVPGRDGILNCRTTPILDKDQKILGRLWIFE
ncbi:PAS domain-containing protein [bacterium]|nr:PAS domain-containing protein [bacterium]